MMVRDGRDILGQVLSLVLDVMDNITAFCLSPMKTAMALSCIRRQKWKYYGKQGNMDSKFIFQPSIFPSWCPHGHFRHLEYLLSGFPLNAIYNLLLYEENLNVKDL